MISARRNFWIVSLILLFSIAAAAVWGSPIYYRLIYLWALLLLTSWVWTRFSLRGVELKRVARTYRQQVGQIFEERFEVTNQNRFLRLWVVVRDKSTLPGTAGSRVLTWIAGGKQRSYLSYTWLTRRGEFTLGPTILESGDLFGLFISTVEYPALKNLLVTPHISTIHSFPSPPGLMPGGRALHRRTLEATPYAAGVREYVPGDSLNRIHWASTARRDRLMVKEFEQDPQADVWIFIDAQKSIQAALPEVVPDLKGDRLWLWRHRPDEVTLPPATIEYAVSIAASISQYYLNLGTAVGLAAVGQTHIVVPAERGERQLGKIIDTLAFLQAEGQLPLQGLTSAQANHLPRGSTVILITPNTFSGVVLAASDLDLRNLKPVIILLDPVTFGAARSAGGVESELTTRGFRTIMVKNGDDLRSALENSSQASGQVRWWSNDGSNGSQSEDSPAL